MLLLAQATPSPVSSPASGATTTGQKATTLSLSDALTRLIPHTADHFAEDRGAKFVSPRGVTGYALNFGIAGLTDCAIVVTESPFAMCVAYRGNDAAAARSAYYAVKAGLHGFAGTAVPIDEAVTTADVATLTTASYRPNANTQVMIEMIQEEGQSVVAITVKPIVSL
jgi:hypothetical protein